MQFTPSASCILPASWESISAKLYKTIDVLNQRKRSKLKTAMEIYRLFVAIEIPQAAKLALGAAQEQLGGGQAAVKWVAPEQIHLTLRFLGDTNSQQLPQIGAAMHKALANHQPIQLQLAAIGAFPSLLRPSVVWAGVGGATAALHRAQSSLEQEFVAIGFAREEREFRAHLTLGRVRRDAAAEAVEQLRGRLRQPPQLPPIAWQAERAVVFRSELRRDGPIYTEMMACGLQIDS